VKISDLLAISAVISTVDTSAQVVAEHDEMFIWTDAIFDGQDVAYLDKLGAVQNDSKDGFRVVM